MIHILGKLISVKALLLFAGLVVFLPFASPKIYAYTAGAKWPGERANYVFDTAYNQLGPGFNARGQTAIAQWNSVGNSDLFRFDTTGAGDNHITVDPAGTCSKLVQQHDETARYRCESAPNYTGKKKGATPQFHVVALLAITYLTATPTTISHFF